MKILAPVITIDGPSGAGKSVICKAIANKLNWFFLESGIIYRALALIVIENNISILDVDLISISKNLKFKILKKKNNFLFFSNGKNISKKIIFQEVSNIASKLAMIPHVRKALLKKQRMFQKFPGLVANGRDMGTVVFPEAKIKFFLKADLISRVNRRMLELKKKGFYIDTNQLFLEMKKRDNRDYTRTISPLVPAKNAIIIDSTNMTIKEVLALCMDHIYKKYKKNV
ncbi:(d)CMP kinase [Buchnera aphidicola (Mindarus keteleerifoliae)]|uniref:(d)CMP kinase n=1 Tax=Buchnera aphidicola TaxID=9 RepID=UPI0031B670ED